VLQTRPAAEFKPIDYPKPDGVLSFDLLTNLARSGTNHEGDQPAHLRIKACTLLTRFPYHAPYLLVMCDRCMQPDKADVPSKVSFAKYAAPETRFCPARVYEYPEVGVVALWRTDVLSMPAARDCHRLRLCRVTSL
jgi:electron-transferring-flavoprotein dehydrogenase